MTHILNRLIHQIIPEATSAEDCARESKEMHENLTEAQIDKTIEDSFPASDPPGWH